MNDKQYTFLHGGGEMGELTRTFDWSETSLGAPDKWPQSLRTIVSVILHSQVPMFLWWGPGRIQFYNDAYRHSLGNEERHSPTLGQKGTDSQIKIWLVIRPVIDEVMAGGSAVWNENQPFPVFRNGKWEEVYWTFSCSPVPDESDGIGGVLVTCQEAMDISGGKRAEMALQESEARFQNLVRDANVGMIVLLEDEMRVAVVNEAWCRLIGHSVKETLHRPLFQVIPEAESYFLPLLQKVKATGEPFAQREAPYKVHSAGGETIEGFIDYVYQPYRQADGNITGVMAVVTDVTEQVVTRRKIAESEARLRAIITNARAAIGAYVGRDMVIENPNQVFIDILGKGPGIAGKPLREALPELVTEGQPFLKILDEVYTTGIPYSTTGTLIKIFRDGEMTNGYYNFSYTPVFDKEGKTYQIVVVAIDVTDQVMARQRLEETEAGLRGAIELAQLGTWTIEVATNGLTYSDRLIEWFGFDPAEQAYSEVIPILQEEDRERVASAVAWALQPESNGVYDEIYTVIHPETGKKRILHALGRTVFDAAGKPLRMVGTAQDITMQRELQLALENEVQSRTEELAAAIEELQTMNEELEESNTQLVHSNEELAQYAYVASHDLQEPLRKIRVFAGLLNNNQDLPQSSKATLGKIGQSAERMSLLIQDLLAFSRLLKAENQMLPVDLSEIVAAVWSDFELAIQEKEATIEVKELPVIEAIGLQINQLFYNLISNSLKFTAQAVRPHITIVSNKIPQEEVARHIKSPLKFSAYYHITFCDNGIGFETEYAEHIFEVFKRLHGRDLYPGSGIGLALCRRIIANHHGHLYAESKVGEGATFHIFLPERQQNDTPAFTG